MCSCTMQASSRTPNGAMSIQTFHGGISILRTPTRTPSMTVSTRYAPQQAAPQVTKMPQTRRKRRQPTRNRKPSQKWRMTPMRREKETSRTISPSSSKPTAQNIPFRELSIISIIRPPLKHWAVSAHRRLISFCL